MGCGPHRTALAKGGKRAKIAAQHDYYSEDLHDDVHFRIASCDRSFYELKTYLRSETSDARLSGLTVHALS